MSALSLDLWNNVQGLKDHMNLERSDGTRATVEVEIPSKIIALGIQRCSVACTNLAAVHTRIRT